MQLGPSSSDHKMQTLKPPPLNDIQLNPAHFQFLYKDEVSKDVTFILHKENPDEIIEIKAHKIVLATQSEVFKKMFFGDDRSEDKVDLKDTHPESFRILIDTCYGIETSLLADILIAVLDAAIKWGFGNVSQVIIDQVNKFIKDHVAPALVALAEKEGLEKLIQKCVEYFCKESKKLVLGGYHMFENLSHKFLHLIVSHDDLDLDEHHVYNICNHWADKECERQKIPVTDQNKRKVLGEIFNQIRFPTMKREEFVAGPYKQSLLDSKEKMTLFSGYKNDFENTTFIKEQRNRSGSQVTSG